MPAQKLTFSLAPPVVANTVIDPVSGVFKFTPSEDQGPGVHSFTIRVNDDAVGRLVDRKSFTVTVNEVNRAPVLEAIPDKSIEVGGELTFVATAVDAYLPPNVLTFALDAGAPEGAKITPGGVFTWTPTDSQGGASYPITVSVTDNGVPPLMDNKAFKVTFAAVQREIRVTEAKVSADGRFSFRWSARAGRSYQVQFKNSLAEAAWPEVRPAIAAAAESAFFSVGVGETGPRFYRVALVP